MLYIANINNAFEKQQPNFISVGELLFAELGVQKRLQLTINEAQLRK